MKPKTMRASYARAILILGAAMAPSVMHAESAPTGQVRDAANKAIRLMESSMAKVNPNVPCVSCHHGMLPIWALGVARDHGLTVNGNQLRATARQSFSGLLNVDAAIQGTHVVDENLDIGELLWFGPEAGATPSVTTALHARRLVNLQQTDGHWKTMDARPPQSYSNFMTTALIGRTVANYLPASRAEKTESIAKARQWLATHSPVSTEDATYRLLGLAWTGAGGQQLRTAAKELASRQNRDGGWSSMPGKESEAYSTGEALYALKSLGQIDTNAFDAGVKYLLVSQLGDGSWHVKSRLHEVAHISPPKMETGFPHGPDHILSMYGTTWAVAALSLSLPEHKVPVAEIAEVRPQAEPWIEAVAFGSTDDLAKVDVNSKTAKGSTPLMVAAADPARAAKLIARGADPMASAKSGHTALSVAATYAGTGNLVRQLIRLGVPAKLGPKTEFHANSLVEVAWTGDAEVARLLIEAGADLNQPMLREGMIPMTPLKAAVALESTEVLRELLKHGANPNSVDEIPMLSWAVLGNRAEAARILLEAGADPEMKDQYGWTPLMHAKGVEHDLNRAEEVLRAAIAKRQAKATE